MATPKKVQGLGESALNQKFPFKNETINVEDYFEREKGITLE